MCCCVQGLCAGENCAYNPPSPGLCLATQEDFMTKSHTGMFVLCILVCPQTSQDICPGAHPANFTWSHRRAIKFLQDSVSFLSHCAFTFQLQSTACILSQMAILSSLPFSCHLSEYQTMRHRWCTSTCSVSPAYFPMWLPVCSDMKICMSGSVQAKHFISVLALTSFALMFWTLVCEAPEAGGLDLGGKKKMRVTVKKREKTQLHQEVHT